MELLDEIIRSVAEVLGDEDLSRKVVRRLTKDFGGMSVYIPQERNAFRNDIEHELYDQFDGANHRQLARNYGFSVPTIREIVRRIRAERLAQERASKGTLAENMKTCGQT